jgi:hypothetical protein
MTRVGILLLLILAFLVSLSSGSSQAASLNVAKVPTVDEAMSNSYQTLLAGGSVIPYGSQTPPSGATKLLQLRNKTIGQEVPSRHFTPKEKNRLGVWVSKDGRNKMWTHTTYSQIFRYYKSHGVLPAGSRDILQDYLTEQNRAAMSSNPSISLDNVLLSLTNPDTGKLYTDFRSSQWTPFGINCEVLDKSEWLSVMPDLKYFPHQENLPFTSMIRVTLYGEVPGTVLEQTIFYMLKENQGSPTPQS